MRSMLASSSSDAASLRLPPSWTNCAACSPSSESRPPPASAASRGRAAACREGADAARSQRLAKCRRALRA
eukprot:724652-Prymnesium_polylepis.1